MPAVTATNRAKRRLQATTALAAPDVLGLVKQSTESAKGGGASLLTSGIANVGARVHVEVEGPAALGLSITSGKRVVELCSFTARVAPGEGGATVLTVGGLESYKTSQPRVLGFIPSGPKSILGYDLYKRYLDGLARAIQSADASAQVVVAVPEG
jgi:hypothetical protein